MAEGQDGVDVKRELGLILGDLNPVRNDLTSISQDLASVFWNLPGGEQVPKFTVTVLSWQISSKKDKEESRDILVSRVVDHVNPDVLLLQGSNNKETIDNINQHCKPRSYENCRNEADDVKVLYDPEVFTFGEPIDLRHEIMNVFPETDEEVKRIFKDHRKVTAFQLEHKYRGKKIVFLSFNNNYSGAKEHKKRRAEGFCDLVFRTANKRRVLVVAGADLRCSNFSRGLARIPKYDAPSRRGEKVFDHIVSAWPDDITVEDHISVLDTDKSPALLNQIFKGSVNDYEESLYHDPLVYRLSVSDVQVHVHV